MLYMRTTLDLPDPLFRELKARAARSGLKLKELLAAYVEAGLQGGTVGIDQSARRPPRSPLPVARRASGFTIPALTNIQMQDLLDEDDGRR